MRAALASHWPEYLIEAAGLGVFMLSACVFGALLGHPASPIAGRVARPLVMRAVMGAAMGATALALILSPWGKRSGAHFNPAVTLAFCRLGKIAPFDAAFYVLAHFVGGTAGVVVAADGVEQAIATRRVAARPHRRGRIKLTLATPEINPVSRERRRESREGMGSAPVLVPRSH